MLARSCARAMPANELDLVAILRELTDANVEFVVVGALAASLQGAPLVTFDLDVVHKRSEENVRRLLTALQKLEATYRDPAGRRLAPDAAALAKGGHHLLITSAGPLDVLGAIEGGRGYEELVTRTIELEVAPHLRVCVAELELLVELKAEGAREKDRAALPILRRTLEEARRRKD
jgi:hypothetical protein